MNDGDIIQQTFQFEMKRIPESLMDIVRDHNVKIIDIEGYAGTDVYSDPAISSIDLDLEGDVGVINKLAVALGAETNTYGYVIK